MGAFSESESWSPDGPASPVMVDGCGRLFADETLPYPFLSPYVQGLGGACWAISDATVVEDSRAPRPGSWSAANLRQGAAEGMVLVADRIDQLAEGTGVSSVCHPVC
jgi:hypothetical protein